MEPENLLCFKNHGGEMRWDDGCVIPSSTRNSFVPELAIMITKNHVRVTSFTNMRFPFLRGGPAVGFRGFRKSPSLDPLPKTPVLELRTSLVLLQHRVSPWIDSECDDECDQHWRLLIEVDPFVWISILYYSFCGFVQMTVPINLRHVFVTITSAGNTYYKWYKMM